MVVDVVKAGCSKWRCMVGFLQNTENKTFSWREKAVCGHILIWSLFQFAAAVMTDVMLEEIPFSSKTCYSKSTVPISVATRNRLPVETLETVTTSTKTLCVTSMRFSAKVDPAITTTTVEITTTIIIIRIREEAATTTTMGLFLTMQYEPQISALAVTPDPPVERSSPRRRSKTSSETSTSRRKTTACIPFFQSNNSSGDGGDVEPSFQKVDAWTTPGPANRGGNQRQGEQGNEIEI